MEAHMIQMKTTAFMPARIKVIMPARRTPG